ncbi:Transposase [Oopsacas minuta]|uniref:Transposase n=1 Tax=Oopsacas minuta TaxID=111878 RepID=A0AAV7JG52_9METZ|nr:Transposase [Oopsacas minuta]
MASNLQCEQRSYIKIRTLLGVGPKDNLIDLEVIYGDASLSYTTVKEWAKCVREGRESLEDKERIGLEEDPHITVEELAVSVGISTGAVHSILIDELKATKFCSRWIPHFLTKDQKNPRVTCARKILSEYKDSDPRRLAEITTGDETWIRYDEPLSKERNKVWVAKGEAPPLNSRLDFRDQKVLYSIFFDAHSPVPKIIIPKGKQLPRTFTPTSACQE